MDIQYQIQGSELGKKTHNFLRQFVEKQIKNVDFSHVKNRPQQLLDFSIGDPTAYKNFKFKYFIRTNPKIIQLVQQGVGLIDGYTHFQGSLECRQYLANHYSNLRFKLNPDDIIITFGGCMAIWLSLVTLANPGDNFLFPTPGFPLIYSMAINWGIQVRKYKLLQHKNWEIDLDSIQSLIDNKTKFILVIDPSNPCGSVWTAGHKKDILNLCQRLKLTIIADQIYQHMVFPEQEYISFGQLTQNVPIIKCSGLTKKYLVPGWMMGWIVLYGKGNVFDLVKKGLKNITNTTLMPNTIVQSKLIEIMEQVLYYRHPSNEIYLKNCMIKLKKRYQILRKGLKQLEFVDVLQSKGTLYVCIGITKDKFDLKSDKEFAKCLYIEENLLVFPGEFFFGQNFIRLVLCADENMIIQFIKRFKKFYNNHLKK